MNHETTANPAGDDDTRLDPGAPSEAEAEAYHIDEELTELPGEGDGREGDDQDDGIFRDTIADVEYEGTTYTVPVPIKDALLRQADYTRKTMDLADQRRAVEARKAEVEQIQALTTEEFQAKARLGEVGAALNELAQYDWTGFDPNDPDVAEVRTTAARLMQEQAALSQLLTEHHHHKNAREQHEIARTRAETDHAMAREIQDWSPARRHALESFAVGLGIAEEDLGHASAAEMRILNFALLGAQQLERQRAANRGAYRPAAEVGGSAGTGPSDPSRMSMAQYRAWRAKQK